MKKMPFAIHSHFYQPIRRDPFTGKIPQEYGSGNYGNFNEKIFHECYFPNVKNRNIDKMSFNIGPTLVEWMEKEHPDVLELYVESDKKSVSADGYGNAIAQAYNHCILPLLDDFSKEIQIVWGIHDFERIFGRKPHGFWFPETAIDKKTIDIVSKYGIKYTFAAQWQVACGYINSPCVIDSQGGDFVIFPYCDQLTRLFISYMPKFSAKSFVDYALTCFMYEPDNKITDYNVNIVAIDGEFLGHHRANRHKVLEKIYGMVDFVLPSNLLAFSGSFLRTEIVNNTSWSCMNNLKRWKGVCEQPCLYKEDCFIISNKWTEQLWDIFQLVKDELFGVFFDYTSGYFVDPEKLIFDYIQYYNKSINQEDLLERAVKIKNMNPEYVSEVFCLLEAIYWSQIMFTSCGFFFEDIYRIEPENNLKYLKKVFAVSGKYLKVNTEQVIIKKMANIMSQKRQAVSVAEMYNKIESL